MALQCLFHFYQNRDLVDKPQVDLRNIMDLFVCDALSDCFCDLPDSSVIYDL